MFIVDAALERSCAEFRLRAADGQITPEERDLLIDGAILLAARIEILAQDGGAGLSLVRAGAAGGADRGWQRAA